MNRKFVIANWKMNKSAQQAIEYVKDLEQACILYSYSARIVLCPPVVFLPSIAKKENPYFQFGVQNFYPEPKGNFTGEIALEMLDDLAISYVIIGHSERRILFAEDEELLLKKIDYAIEHNYNVIYCIGETKQEKESGKTKEVLQHQLSILKNTSLKSTIKLLIAYEPIWAIGSGCIPSALDIKLAILDIKNYIKEVLDHTIESIYTLYGGSVTQDNVASILTIEGVDGVLVGSASLQCESFINIVTYASGRNL